MSCRDNNVMVTVYYVLIDRVVQSAVTSYPEPISFQSGTETMLLLVS